MNFSFVLIVRNEEKTLPRLLKSLGEFRSRGGQVCVLDTGSTDKTAEIAREAGCKVEEVGEKFIRRITGDLEKKINDKFRLDGDFIVRDGDKLFDYASARNYAATLSDNDWVWMPDADEYFTILKIDEIEEAISDPEVDMLEYNFVFSHLPDGSPGVSFKHSKCYNRKKYLWRGIVHECLFPIKTDG